MRPLPTPLLILLLLLPAIALAQSPLDTGILKAYTDGHRTLAFALHILAGGFVALRLGWRWRRERIYNATYRALIPAGAYTLTSCIAVAILWLIASTDTMRAVNLLSLSSFLLGTASGAFAAFLVYRRVVANLPAAKPSLDDEIARRLAELRKDGEG